MVEYFSKKRKKILSNLDDAQENNDPIREAIVDAKIGFKELEKILDKSWIQNERSRGLFRALPEDFEDDNPILDSYLGSALTYSTSILKHSDNLKRGFKTLMDDINQLKLAAYTTSTTSYSLTSFADGIGDQLVIEHPDIRPHITKLKDPSPHKNRDDATVMLKQIKPDFAIRFNAAWDTFEDITQQDRYRQSAHSMREVLNHLLKDLAPDNEVMETEWFKPVTRSRCPSRNQRTKYAILGSSSTNRLDKLVLEPIMHVMSETSKVYSNLSQVSHVYDESSIRKLAEIYLNNAQKLIIDIITLRKMHK